jgi:hypothetical protein
VTSHDEIGLISSHLRIRGRGKERRSYFHEFPVRGNWIRSLDYYGYSKSFLGDNCRPGDEVKLA